MISLQQCYVVDIMTVIVILQIKKWKPRKIK